LEKIVKSGVGERLVVTFDSGVRGAADVIKAIALGAKFVFVGRLWIWGLAIMGEDGVKHVMKGLLADLDILMNVSGINRIDEIGPEFLESTLPAYGLLNLKSKL
jgi:isopentenyl diphosphate isomerase/L-lactate dehydrogenase-like FMN-dependent dehydrogenase